MRKPVHYSVGANWKNRVESDEAVAGKIRHILSILRPIDVLYSKWSYVDFNGACFDYDEWDRCLIDMINGRVCKGDFDEPRPDMGFHIIAVNAPDVIERPQTTWIIGRVGGRMTDWVSVSTSHHVDPDPRLIRYPVQKQILLAIYDVFAPDYVYAAPSDIEDLSIVRREKPPMPLCWMIKLSPPLARAIVPPATVISEGGADGSLFMSATDQTFVTANPAHFAGAKAIDRVLDPSDMRGFFR